ncbi:MAG: kinase/pyrophosphorylase [Rickettsiaceae bacterium]|nr:MAG: kinase/pyrophosphorylase [Rickettsiaceae bacterium]
MKKLIVHMISDSSGQTVKHATKTALAQFSGVETKKYNWLLIRNNTLLKEVQNKIKDRPGIVLYTISNYELRENLKKFCHELQIPCISVIGKIVKQISSYLGIRTENDLGTNHKFDISYFDKVDAIDYSFKHDDGQAIENLAAADIILVGPSRTSKTPTSVYLAYNGFKTANVPYIYACPFPETLIKLSRPLIVGLVISPTRLVEIRENRLNSLQINEHTDYTDLRIVQIECLEVKRICQSNQWPVIDVSRKSIEETAALIMKLYYSRTHRISTNS